MYSLPISYTHGHGQSGLFSSVKTYISHLQLISTRRDTRLLENDCSTSPVTPLFLAENIPKSVSDALRWCYEKCQPESLDTFYASCVDALETEAHKGEIGDHFEHIGT